MHHEATMLRPARSGRIRGRRWVHRVPPSSATPTSPVCHGAPPPRSFAFLLPDRSLHAVRPAPPPRVLQRRVRPAPPYRRHGRSLALLRGRSLHALRRVACRPPRPRHRRVHPAPVPLQQLLQEPVVQELRPARLRQERPQQERKLERVVERDPVQQRAREGFQDGEEGVDDPVDEPLGDLPGGTGAALEGGEGLVGRVGEAGDGADGAGGDAEEDDEEEDEGAGGGEALLGDVRLLLWRVGRRGRMVWER